MNESPVAAQANGHAVAPLADDLPAGVVAEEMPPPPPADPLDLWYAEAFEGYPPAETPVCEALGLGPGRPTCLVAYAGSGKTFLAADLAMAVSDPSDYATCWGDLVIDRQGPVVFLDGEVGKHKTWKRFQRLAYGRGKTFKDWGKRLAWRSYPKFSLGMKDAEEILTQVCEGKVLCVVDSLKRLLVGVDQNDNAASELLAILARVSEVTGCAFFLIHHEGKPSGDGAKEARFRGRGTSGFQDEWGSQWALTPKGGALYLEQGKAEDANGPQPFYLRLEDIGERDPALRYTPGIRVVRLSEDEVERLQEQQEERAETLGPMKEAMRSALAALKARGPLSYGDLVSYTRGQTNLRKVAIEKLVEQGSILTRKEGNKNVHYLLDSSGSGTSTARYHTGSGTYRGGTRGEDDEDA